MTLPRPDQITTVLGKLRAAETESREYARRAYRDADRERLFEAARKTWLYVGERESLNVASEEANAVVAAFASEKSTPLTGYRVPTYKMLEESVNRLCTAYERALEALEDD